MTRPMLFAAIIGLPVLLSACASTPAVRTLASGTGRYVESLQNGTVEVIAAQNRLNRVSEQRLASLDLAGERARAGVRQQRLVWTADGSGSLLAAHARATAVVTEQVLASLTKSEVAPPQVGNPAAAGYQKTIKSLAEIRAKPKPFDSLIELITFGQAVKDKYDELQKVAAEETDKAAETAPATPQ